MERKLTEGESTVSPLKLPGQLGSRRGRKLVEQSNMHLAQQCAELENRSVRVHNRPKMRTDVRSA
jgi:hypothetical protein